MVTMLPVPPHIPAGNSVPPCLTHRLSGRVLESSPIHEADEADAYERLTRRHPWLFVQPFVSLVASLDIEYARVLDIGTGPGSIPIELARRMPGWTITGIDVSKDMVAKARLNAEAAGVAQRVQFAQASATDLPFPAGQFDLVISHFMLHHIERPEDLLDEAARVVRGGGKVIIKDIRRQPSWKVWLLAKFAQWALGHTSLQMRLYRESLAAALTINEARQAMRQSRLALGKVQSYGPCDLLIMS